MEGRMEKPGQFAEPVTPKSAVAWQAFMTVAAYSPSVFPIMLTCTKCILFHSDDAGGGFPNVCAWTILFLISYQRSVSSEPRMFQVPLPKKFSNCPL